MRVAQAPRGQQPENPYKVVRKILQFVSQGPVQWKLSGRLAQVILAWYHQCYKRPLQSTITGDLQMSHELETQLRLLEHFLSIDTNIDLTGVKVLLTAAKHSPCNQAQIRKFTGATKSSVSRWVGYWGEGPWLHNGRKRQGRGLLKVAADPTDARYDIIRLTPKGREYLRIADEIVRDAAAMRKIADEDE